jgi:KaiC/GvpD/RAD55 family RecA-like ATPase
VTQILDFNNALKEKELTEYLAGGSAPDKDKVRQGLTAACEHFIAWLFPNAIVTPRNARVGNIYGSPGSSLVIETKGAKRGVWADFADPTQKGGDLIELYMAVKGIGFAQALQELADWVGHGTRPEVNYQRDQAVRKLKKVERDLGPQKGEWHYVNAEGVIVATVYRFEPEPGKKEFLPWDAEKRRYGNPDIRPLYNIPGVLASPTVVLTEGEKAAQALIDRGVAATCVMGGCNSPLDRTDFAPLRGKKVTIWPDNDEPGRKFGAAIANALRCVASEIDFIDPPEGVPAGWDAADDDAPERFLGQAAPASPQQLAPLPFEWAGEVSPVIDGFWLIDDWLPSNGIAAVYGHPGCGKSFLTFHMAAHVAAGKPWAGRRVEKGLVVYVVAEGTTGARNRLYAMQQAGDIAKDAPFAIVPTPIDMQAEAGDVRALIDTITVLADIKGMRVAMIALDTLSKTFGAGKENTDDMVNYVNNCQRVASAFQCLTLVVHHRPKDQESRDLRGHSSLRGNVDTTILVEGGEIKTATTLKQKDGEDNVQVRFKLHQVAIGKDRHGKERTTCLVEITDETPTQSLFEGLNKSETRALEVLCELIEKQQIDPETGEILSCPGLICSAAWKAALRTSRTISPDNFETAARQYRRIRNGLESKGKIEFQGDMVGLGRTGADK